MPNLSKKFIKLLESLEDDLFCHLEIFPENNKTKQYYICFTSENYRNSVQEDIDDLFKEFGGTVENHIDDRFIENARRAGVLPFKYCLKCNIPIDNFKNYSPGKIKDRIIDTLKSVGFGVGYSRS